MKALLALPGFRPEIDRQACYDFLGLGYIPEPATGFANIQALPRGSCLTISRQGHHLREYEQIAARDRKSTRLNSSHGYISYAVFCLKKKKLQVCQSPG